MDADDRRYLALNAVGAVVLVASALLVQLWGFVALNVVWAGASALGLMRGRVNGEDLRRHATSPHK